MHAELCMMSAVTSLFLWLKFVSILLVSSIPTAIAQLDENGFRPPIPTYFVDPNLIKLSLSRFRSCGVHFVNDNRTIFALEELAYLSTQSASEYFRGHELLAYHFFVENRANNPHFREYINDAEMEYIPIVPLAWRTYRAGCSYSSFITMLLKINEYMNIRDAQVLESEPTMVLPRRFFVASSFNMRTQWGTGMPTPYRRGVAWESMSTFIQSLSVGHYERWPECPDLLRKWWKFAVELPFLSINSVRQLSEMSLFPKNFDATLNYTYLTQVSKQYQHKHLLYSNMPTLPIVPVPTNRKDVEEQKWYTILNQHDDNAPSTSTAKGKKQYTFFFAGHFELPGPELVCSTRNNILNLHYERSDFLVMNLTSGDSNRRAVIPILSEYMARSVFCIITPGDSYSSSFFYHAISNGCIPLVINDWFVFAYPWLIHYESFVLRISENEFNMNPSYIFDTIKEHYLLPNPYLLRSMQRMMKYMVRYLTWKRTDYMTDDYYDLLSADVHYYTRNSPFGLLDTLDVDNTAEKAGTFLPMELMLLELRYESLQHNYYQNVPCLRPLWCSHDYQSNASWLPKLPNPWKQFEPITVIGNDLKTMNTAVSTHHNHQLGQEHQDSVPKHSPITSSLFPANAKTLPFRISVLKKTFERHRGMSWSIFPTALSFAEEKLAKEKGWWVQEGDYFQVHAFYVPPPSAVYATDVNNNGNNDQQNIGIPDLYYQTNRNGEIQRGKLSTSIPDRRSYLCAQRPRLIGIYKIVFFMQCVRVLWTLNPGKFKPKDNVKRFAAATVPLPADSNSNIDESNSIVTNNMLTREEYDFTMAFHNITRHPNPHWVKENYPLAFKHSSYYSFNRSEEIRIKAFRQRELTLGQGQLQRIYTVQDILDS